MASRLPLLLILLSSALSAPSPAQTAAPKYPNEPFVIESMSTKIAYQDDGTGTRETTARIRIQSQAGVQTFGVLNFPYEKNFDEVTLDYVRVRKPDGQVIETPAADVQDLDTPVSRAAPMYSDERTKQAAVKNLSVGDTIEYHSISRMLKPAAPGHFWMDYSFFRDGIVLDEQVELSVPADKFVNVKSADVQPTITQENGRKIYRWKTANLRRKTEEEKAKESKIEPPPPSIQVSTFRTWDAVGKWYAGLQRDRVTPSADVRAKALELTKDAKTERDKARAIYAYVSSNFRYIGLEFGVGRYQPHSADNVFRNRYGDCKDKETLLAAMLQAVGIHIDPVLINSSRRTVDMEVPTPAQFDHVIGVVTLDEKSYWLDTTPQVAPFGMLLYGLRDKKALVASDTPEWRKTPANAPVEATVTFESTGELKDDGQFQGTIERTLAGEAAIPVRAALGMVGQPQWTELIQQISYRTGFQGTVSDVSITGVDNVEKPLDIRYSYLRKDYSQWTEKKQLSPSMPPVSIFPIHDEQDESNDPITLAGPFHEQFRAVMTLPEGFTPEMLADVNLHTDFANYKATYKLEGRKLTAVRELTVKQRELPRTRLAEFNKFAEAVTDDENSMFVAKTTSNENASAAASAVGNILGLPSDSAAQLYQQGRQQMQARNVDAALALFQKAAAADPKYRGVWTAIGFCYLVQGKSDDAIKALRKEVGLYPQDPIANKTLAQALYALRRPDEALEAMKAYVKAAPDDVQAVTALATEYSRKGQYQDAQEILEPALQKNPENSSVLFALGMAYMGENQGEKAVATMRKVVALKSGDPGMMNDSAYVLADHKLDLDEAEQWAEQAAKAEEGKTAEVDLGHLTVDDLKRVTSIAADWDTLGWVYFRRGNLISAEKYLKASWELSQDPTVGNHLAQLYDAEKKSLPAAKMYALSYHSPTPMAFGAESKDPANQRLIQLVGHTKAAEMLRSAGEDLSMARTYRLPAVTKAVATGEVFLLLSHGTVKDVQFVSGEAPLKRSVAALKTAAARTVKAEMPDDPVNIVRRAIVVCHTAYCEMVLMTPDSVRSVN